MKNKVTVTINGASQSHEVEPRLLLVHFIRELAGLTGTHVGCDTSQCGACTIHLNGQAVKSCTPARGAGRRRRRSRPSRGWRRTASSTRSRKAFWEKHGLQCGFCTPGMIMSAAQLIQRYPKPYRGRHPPRARGQSLPLHRLSQHRQGHPVRRREHGEAVGEADHGDGRSCWVRASSAARIRASSPARAATPTTCKLPGDDLRRLRAQPARQRARSARSTSPSAKAFPGWWRSSPART